MVVKRTSLVRTFLGEVGTTNESSRVAWIEAALADVPDGSRILDAGAGERQFRHFCSHLNYVSQDFARYEPSTSQGGLHPESWDPQDLDIISDIVSIPEPDASFEAILCTEVLEHLPYPHRAIDEFARLLTSGGFLILTAPFCSLTHFAPYHFCTGFNRFFYERVLDEAGFDVIELTSNGNYFEYLAQEVRRLPIVARRYTSPHRIWKGRLTRALLLHHLNKLSRTDTGSSELLCYGMHVRARRR
jgi:SAM-dependent methyltransferase